MTVVLLFATVNPVVTVASNTTVNIAVIDTGDN